jgi:hypothetical protein
VAAGKKLGDGTNLAIDGLKNDCGVLIGVPGVVYDLSDINSADSFLFHLEGHAKIWYNTIPDSQKANFDNLITLFKKRFKKS